METPTATLPTAAPVVANGQEPPACTFPLAQITTIKSAPENYTFSEPKVVLTAPIHNYYNIAQWLPDNQQVLMTEILGNSFVMGKDNYSAKEFISLYNPVTGESKVYAIRPVTHESPSWLIPLNAVAYPVMNYTGPAQFTRQLWISYEDPTTAQKLADDLPQFPLGVKPDGSKLIYFSDNKIIELDKSLKAINSTPFDPAQWDYAKSRRNSDPVSFGTAWQPDTSLIFFYSAGDGGGGYTFILNADTGQVCELNLGGMAFEAHWSSDGRYLAFIRSTQYWYPTYSADLTVLDTVTGTLKVLSVLPQEKDGAPLVDDFVWAPDNHHLLAFGETYMRGSQDNSALYLIDFVSGKSNNVTPSYEFYTNSGSSMAWSPDGSKVVVRCPTNLVDRICLISVQKSGQ